MKKQSYDIPAYKFGIIKINDIKYGSKQYSNSDYRQALEDGRFCVIPFEDVDGLEVSEVIKYLDLNEIFFHCYTYFKDYKKINHYGNVASYIFDSDVLQENLSVPIDQLIEAYFEFKYAKADIEDRRVYNCFFERYQDKSCELTEQRIKILEQSNLSQE